MLATNPISPPGRENGSRRAPAPSIGVCPRSLSSSAPCTCASNDLNPRRAPSLYAIPLELQLYIHLRDRRSREEWKRLPLEALPPHAGPALVFDLFDAPVQWVDDWSGRTLQSNLELDEIVADQFKFRRAGEGLERAKLAKRIRRRWVALVDHAIGYRVPGTPDVLEFA